MILVDGKALANAMHDATKERIAQLVKPPRLAVVACAPNFETRSYLELKKRTAENLGVTVEVIILPDTATSDEVKAVVKEACLNNNGVIVQLPLPPHIDTEFVLSTVPTSHDVDNFRYQGEVTEALPPVVGAVDFIAKHHNIAWLGKKVVIIGAGRLVGAPLSYYLKSQGVLLTVLTNENLKGEIADYTIDADIIIMGTGTPGLLLPDMVRAGVIVFDAGTTEAGGVLVGDADPAVAAKASLFTPVPGGIGPLTVAVLFRNLLELTTRQ